MKRQLFLLLTFSGTKKSVGMFSILKRQFCNTVPSTSQLTVNKDTSNHRSKQHLWEFVGVPEQDHRDLGLTFRELS